MINRFAEETSLGGNALAVTSGTNSPANSEHLGPQIEVPIEFTAGATTAETALTLSAATSTATGSTSNHTGAVASRTETLAGGSQIDAMEDNSYMVSAFGPTSAAEATVCSDVDLGISASGVKCTTHGDRVVLRKGNVLFVPFRNTVVETPHGTISIDAKSTVLISIVDDKLAVYDLEDNHKNAVSVSAHRAITPAPQGV